MISLSRNQTLLERPDMLSLSAQATETPIHAAILEELLDAYLNELSLPPATITSYRYQLGPFRAWWSQHAPTTEYVLTQTLLAQFLPWARKDYRNSRNKKASAATVRSGCVRVRQFFKWLHRTGRLPIDISDWLPLPKKRSSRKRYLSMEQCQQLFDAVPDGALRYRDRALVAFLLATGTRRFEAAAALWEDVHLDDNGGWCRLRKTKGDAEGEGVGRIVVFGHGTAQALHAHRQFLRITGQSGRDARVFAMTNTAIKNRFNKFSEKLGWTIGPHDLRRTFADFWWNENREHMQALALLKLQLGHRMTNDVTLTHYVNLDNEERLITALRAAYVGPVELLRVLPDVS